MIREVLLGVCVFVAVLADQKGCVKDGAVGVCIQLRNCQTALAQIKIRQHPQVCGFDYSQYELSVCCFDYLTTTTTTTESLQQSIEDGDDYSDEDDMEDTCQPIPPQLTAPKTGEKAWDKCLEYQNTLVYPCEMSDALSFNAGMERNLYCHRKADDLVIGGTSAARNEFPHMALLGNTLQDGEDDINWVCGGSLISDKFILTAGHCIASRMYGVVSFAFIGALSRSEVTTNSDRLYKVKQIFKHPDYHPPNKYNDIALLELDRRVKLDKNTVPACLPVGERFKDDKVTATGWGLTEYEGSASDTLQKVTLTKFSSDECKQFFPPSTEMNKGYDEAIQMCYGDKQQAKDTCQGDSGGPLQIDHDKINCMHVVVGITSTGHACGFVGQPAVYTRVSHYVPWIESIVWP